MSDYNGPRQYTFGEDIGKLYLKKNMSDEVDGDEDPEIDYSLNYTFNKAQKRVVNVALSNTFGFGGHNACVALRKMEAWIEKK